MIASMSVAGTMSSTSDNKAVTSNKILNVTILNVVTVVLLCIVALLYIKDNTDAYDTYVMVILHITLLMSIISASIAALHQL